MGVFYAGVQALVGRMNRFRSMDFDRLGVTTQFIRHNKPGLTELLDLFLKEMPGGLSVSALLNKNVEGVTISVDGAPEPILHPANDDHNLNKVPQV